MRNPALRLQAGRISSTGWSVFIVRADWEVEETVDILTRRLPENVEAK